MRQHRLVILHVGSARSALFNWLFARRYGGQFVLRVEDTDESKKTQEFVDAILEPLRLAWDLIGMRVRISNRNADTPTRPPLSNSSLMTKRPTSAIWVQSIRSVCLQRPVCGRGYHGWSRDRGVADGDGVVVRFRAPDEGSTIIEDLVRGRVEVAHDTIEDFVIRRGDGSPVFLIANAVDDHDMGITHVIRGEDLLNTTPRVKLLWEALGYGPPPRYAHLPLLVNEQRKKLSKRRDSVALSEFVADGYLPEAIVNALALLGWGPPDEIEIRPIEEIVALFSLEAVNKGAAFFDLVKLKHINNAYIKALAPSEFVEAAAPWLPAHYDHAVVEALAPEVQQRISTLSEAPDWLDWLFVDEISQYDEKAWAKAMVKGRAADRVLADLAVVLAAEPFEDAALLEAAVFEVGTRLSEELGARVMSQAPLRIALTGSGAGIPLWEAMVHLGKEKTLSRIAAARSRLAG